MVCFCLTLAGKTDADSNINSPLVVQSGRDIDLEATFDCESNQHIGSGTKIRRCVNDIILRDSS